MVNHKEKLVAEYPFQQVHIEKYKKAATFERSSYVAEVL